MNPHRLLVRNLAIVDFKETFLEMRAFTESRDESTSDECWLLQHRPVYTQGYSCTLQPNHETSIPIESTDRGGQITYHGPGQLVVYLMIDLKRRKQGIRNFVRAVENAVISTLKYYQIDARQLQGAPGVYVGQKKISSFGIRVRRGCTYHGLSLNVDMDTSAFDAIDVCGYRDLAVTTMRQCSASIDCDEVQVRCVEDLARNLNYRQITYLPTLPKLP